MVLALAATALLQVTRAQEEGVPTAGGLLLPVDPLTELVLRIEGAEAAGTAKRSELQEPPWPEWRSGADSGWNREEPWRRWVELVRAEARAESPHPGTRARLALLARAQGRDTDAWRHLLRCGTDALVLDLLPAFLPGVPEELLCAETLPDGVFLRPALPPSTDDSRERLATLAGRSMAAREVRIGGATISFELAVQGDGIQVDLVHLAGPCTRVRLVLPVPRGVDIALTYEDWEKLADPRAPVLVELSAEDPEHTVWGRFQPRRDRWPMTLPGEDARAVRARAPLALAVPEEDGDPRLARFAEALAELFDRPCLHPYEPSLETAGPFEPIVLHLGAGFDPDRKLTAMISLSEIHALAGAAR